MARIVTTLFALVALFLVATPALADDAQRLGVHFTASVSGSDNPAVILQPQEDVKKVVVKLVREDQRSQTLTAAGVKAGEKKELAVKQEAGKFAYTADFKVDWASGESSEFKMKFSLSKAHKLEVTLKPEDVDLDARKIKFTINNPAKMAELVIVGQNGQPLKTIKKDFAGAAPGSALEVTWDDPGGDILYMDLKVHDTTGFWKGVRLTPFSISIPHDDVEFESGKWNIRKSEEPKLEKTMKHIQDALEKHGTLLTLKLYIAGYTDTVGSKAANQTLSQNRARSIAAWFRKNGLKIPIFYQGFGEEVLAKATPDETDEQANRRAVYILSSQIPSKSGQIPKQNWSAL